MYYLNLFEFNLRQDGKMTTTVWMDSRPDAVLSTTASPVLMSSDISRRLKDGTVVYVPRPQSVGQYQSFFRGVDIFD